MPSPKSKPETELDSTDIAKAAWFKTEKGKKALATYAASEKGKLAHKRYQTSTRGKLATRKYHYTDKGQITYQKRRAKIKSYKEIEQWLKDNPGKTITALSALDNTEETVATEAVDSNKIEEAQKGDNE